MKRRVTDQRLNAVRFSSFSHRTPNFMSMANGGWALSSSPLLLTKDQISQGNFDRMYSMLETSIYDTLGCNLLNTQETSDSLVTSSSSMFVRNQLLTATKRKQAINRGNKLRSSTTPMSVPLKY